MNPKTETRATEREALGLKALTDAGYWCQASNTNTQWIGIGCCVKHPTDATDAAFASNTGLVLDASYDTTIQCIQHWALASDTGYWFHNFHQSEHLHTSTDVPPFAVFGSDPLSLRGASHRGPSIPPHTRNPIPPHTRNPIPPHNRASLLGPSTAPMHAWSALQGVGVSQYFGADAGRRRVAIPTQGWN